MFTLSNMVYRVNILQVFNKLFCGYWQAHSKLYFLNICMNIYACMTARMWIHMCEGELYGSSKLILRFFFNRATFYSSYLLRQGLWINADFVAICSFAIQFFAEIFHFYFLCTRITGWLPCSTGIYMGVWHLKFNLYTCSASSWAPAIVLLFKGTEKFSSV